MLVEGRLVSDPETGGPKVFTRQDGSAGSAYEVNASTVRFLSSRDDDGTGYPANQAEEDAVPF